MLALLLAELTALDIELLRLRAAAGVDVSAPVAAEAVGEKPASFAAALHAAEAVRVGGTSARGPAVPRSAGARLVRTIIEVIGVVAAAFVLAMLIQHFLVKPFFIPSESMVPTLQKGDRVLVNRVAYGFGSDPQRGDVVVFLSPIGGYEDLIKRVVAVAGDRVAIRGGRLWVNGTAQNEPYVNGGDTAGLMPEQTIPAGKVFVMGDNRNRQRRQPGLRGYRRQHDPRQGACGVLALGPFRGRDGAHRAGGRPEPVAGTVAIRAPML